MVVVVVEVRCLPIFVRLWRRMTKWKVCCDNLCSLWHGDGWYGCCHAKSESTHNEMNIWHILELCVCQCVFLENKSLCEKFVVVSIPVQGKMGKCEAAILSMLKIVSLSSWCFLSSFSKWIGTADIVAKPTNCQLLGVILFQRSFVDLCVMFYCGHDCVDVRCVCVADLVGEICMALKKRKKRECERKKGESSKISLSFWSVLILILMA